MSATSTFSPPPPREVELTQEDDITVPEPLPQEEEVKKAGFQRFMPFVMIGVMLLMMAVMITMRSGMGGGMNPMMFMFPVMMLMSMLMMFAGQSGGTNTGELNKQRKDYSYSLRETRKLAHSAGREVHDAMCKMFPNPAILEAYVGRTDTREPVMWQYNAENPGGLVAFEGTVDEVSFKPYMSARLGTGITNLIPNLSFSPLSVPETLEPVTTTQFRSFVRTQGFVPNIPIGVNLESSGAFAINGDTERKYGLIRAMLMSLMFNHSPNVLRVAVITDRVEDPKWEWVKWAQHALHPSSDDLLGPKRMVYSDMRSFEQDVPEALGDRAEGIPHWIVVVDKPNDEVTLPQRTGMSSSGYNATFLVVSARVDRIATSKSARYEIDADGEITLPYTDAKLNGDFVSLEQMDTFCRSMFCFKPPSVGLGEYAADEEAPAFVHRTWLEVLGIDDIDEWSPKRAWSANEHDDGLITPLGYEFDTVNGRPTERVVAVNAAEATVGGSGPHGVGQGKSGTGKSIMLAAYVLGLAARYSPEKIAFILMDFKGGSTFQGYDKLPHTVAMLSNLAESTDLLDRAYLVISGETQRRQELIDEYKCKDIREYRQMRAKDPSMPPLPYLFLVVDEFREFITDHREYLKLFESVAAVGRSLGFHMMLVSQYIDSSIIGEGTKTQLGYAVSLTASNASQSRDVIGVPDAADLPSGKGDAFVQYKVGPDAEKEFQAGRGLQRFRTFFTEDIYVPPEREAPMFESTSLGQEIEDTAGDSAEEKLIPYTITPQVVQVAEDPVVIEEAGAGADALAREQERKEQIKANAGKEMMMKNVLIDRIMRDPAAKKVLDLWKPSMRVPLTFHNVNIPQRTELYPKMVSTVGRVDDPYHHDQYPWNIDFSNPRTSNWLLSGARGSGKTLAMEAIIASTARSYPPDAAQFLILSYAGAKIKEVADYPHVVGYADGNNEDYVERFFGEIERIVAVRQRYATQWASADANAFLESKRHKPIDEDPYGRLFFFIDGLGSMMVEAGGQFDQAASEFAQKLGTLLSRGPNVGVHIVASTVAMNDVPMKLRGNFSHMYFVTDDPSEVADRDTRAIVQTLPSDQPGRSVVDKKHARVLVPQSEEIKPVSEKKGTDLYDPTMNYGQNVVALARQVRKAYEDHNSTILPQVVPAPALQPYHEMWEQYSRVVDRNSRDAYLPFGLRTQDLHVVDLKYAADMQHLLVLGEPKSGKTNTLRVLLNDVVSQKTRKQAVFLFYDPRGEFFVEERFLKKRKQSLGRARNSEEMFEMLEPVVELLEDRVPSIEEEESMTREQLQNRSWYKGPDVFILVDNLRDLEKANTFGGETSLSKLGKLLKSRNDLGCYVFAASRSSDASYMGTANASISDAIMNTSSGLLLLSGEKQDGKVGPVGFNKMRPGKGKFYDSNRVSMVQVAYAEEWDESET